MSGRDEDWRLNEERLEGGKDGEEMNRETGGGQGEEEKEKARGG